MTKRVMVSLGALAVGLLIPVMVAVFLPPSVALFGGRRVTREPAGVGTKFCSAIHHPRDGVIV